MIKRLAALCLLLYAASGLQQDSRAQGWLPLAGSGTTVSCNFATAAFTNCPLATTFHITRTSNETYTDASGNLTYVAGNSLASGSAGLQVYGQATNILLRSSALTNAAWTDTNVTVTGAQAGPDASSNAILIVPSTANNIHIVSATSGVTGSSSIYTGSIYFYPAGYNFAFVQMIATATAKRYTAVVNLTTGAITDTASIGSPTNISSSAVLYSNGWVRIILQMQADTTSNSVYLGFGASNSATPSFSGVALPSFIGDGASGVYAFGPQVELGSASTPYIPTVAAAATRSADIITVGDLLASTLALSNAAVAVNTSNSQQSVAAALIDANGTVLLGKTSGNVCTTSVGAPLSSGNTATWSAANACGLTWTPAGGKISLNGSSASDLIARTPLPLFHLGSVSGSSAFWNGNIVSINASNPTVILTDARTSGSSPSFAKAFGITQTVVFDDFTSTATIDVINSLTTGFNWYLNNYNCWQGTCGAAQPASPAQYSASNSILSINNQFAPAGGLQFSTQGYLGGTSTVGTVPLISGAKPFYVEINSQFTNQQYSTFWMQDLSSILRSVNNSGNGATLAEFDITEVGSRAPSTDNFQNLHVWTSPTANTTPYATDVGAWSQSDYNTWGLLVVPMSYNGGVGFAQFYKNGLPSGAQINWNGGDTYGIEASMYMIFFAVGNNPPAPLNIDYVGAWAHP